MAKRWLIVNGDDFGRSSRINEAIIRAHREGILTSASLVVTGEAFAEAVVMAKETPSLAVGLHLVLAGGRAVLPPKAIPHLVDENGYFTADPFRAGCRYFFSPACRRELSREIEAQFARFAATGLPLSHVDGHLHLHLHPVVFAHLLPLAVRYKAKGIRLPHDDFRTAIAYDHRFFLRKAAWNLALSFLSRTVRPRLRRCRLVTPDRVYGLLQTGEMREDYLLFVLSRLRGTIVECYFHPSSAFEEALGPNPVDLATLVSPAVRQALQEEGIRLTSYAALGEG
ncbi:MAG: hopanoid biosynthesis-associated protein HpnK [Firmicutes bacterium]|nr:hopanoid biosynthesis-associated protein HpnK [Bacillota bacterium]